MKVTTLKAENFKGQCFEHSMKEITVFVGPNFAGKTARLDAVTLGLLGYVPRLGKRNQDAFQYASGKRMSVTIETDKGTYERTWEQGKSISYTGHDGPIVEPVLLDAAEYFALSERERMKLVFRLCQSGLSKDMVPQLSAKLKSIPATEGMLDAGGIIDEMLGKVKEVAKGLTPQEQIGAVVEMLSAQKKEYEAAARKLSGAVAVSDATATVTEPVNLEAMKEEADKLRLLVTQAMVKKSELEKAIGFQNHTAARRAELEALIANKPKVAGQLIKTEWNKAKHDKLSAALNNSRTTLASMTAKRDATEQRKDELTVALKSLYEDVETVLSNASCPVCRAEGNEWKARYAAKTDEQKAVYKQQMDTIAAEIRSLNKAIECVEKEIPLITQELLQSDHEYKAHQQRAQQALEAQKDMDLITRLEAELAALPEAKDDLALHSELSSIEDKMDEMNAELQSLNMTIRQNEINAAAEKERSNIVNQTARIKTAAVFYKAALKLAESIQAEIVESVFVKLLETANKLCGTFLLSPLVYHDGEIGRMSGKQFISVATFSGTETAAVFAALSLALAAGSGQGIVIIDELGRMDSDHKSKFMGKVSELIDDGTITQFIGADWSTNDYRSDWVVKI